MLVQVRKASKTNKNNNIALLCGRLAVPRETGTKYGFWVKLILYTRFTQFFVPSTLKSATKRHRDLFSGHSIKEEQSRGILSSFPFASPLFWFIHNKNVQIIVKQSVRMRANFKYSEMTMKQAQTSHSKAANSLNSLF